MFETCPTKAIILRDRILAGRFILEVIRNKDATANLNDKKLKNTYC